MSTRVRRDAIVAVLMRNAPLDVVTPRENVWCTGCHKPILAEHLRTSDVDNGLCFECVLAEGPTLLIRLKLMIETAEEKSRE